MRDGVVVAVCLSRKARLPRQNAGEGRLAPGVGLIGDAGSALACGVISLLALEQIERANRKFGLDATPGTFGEHLTIEGGRLSDLATGDRLKVGEARLEVIRVGDPEAFVHLNAYRGVSLLPRWGVYCRVLDPGRVQKGDPVHYLAD
ncbi:MAG: MOSC domain-containing protein [Anaerolineae bacterium]